MRKGAHAHERERERGRAHEKEGAHAHERETETETERERVCVCVCTSVRGGALLDPCDIVFPPHEPPHKVRGQERNNHKNGLGPVAVLCRLSLEQRETLHQIILLCVPLNHHSFSPSLTFLAAALFSAAHLELPVPLPALPASDSNHSPPGTAPPQLDLSCEANREKDGESPSRSSGSNEDTSAFS